jgi:hypothetical protein
MQHYVANDIGQLSDCQLNISQSKFKLKHELWYRGHASSAWKLVPKVHRSHTLDEECDMVQSFRLRAPSRYHNCPPRENIAEWLSLMQHYGLPTRLLDWTKSLLVATYFAVGYETSPGPATVWVLSPSLLNRRFGLDRGIYQLTQKEVRDVLLAAFKRDWPVEKKAFAVRASEIDIRMLLQQSAFTIHGDPTPLEEMPGAEEFVVPITIPADAKPFMSAQIEALGVRRSDLFPDLSSLARELSSASFGSYSGV